MDKKKLYEQIMSSVAKEVKKALNENESNQVIYEDILEAMKHLNPQEIIEDEGECVKYWISKYIMYVDPETNGNYVESTAVRLATQMIKNNWTYDQLYNRYKKMLKYTI